MISCNSRNQSLKLSDNTVLKIQKLDNPTVKLSSLVSSLNYIVLGKDVADYKIGEIRSVFFYKDTIVTFDYQNGSIGVFNSSGVYLNDFNSLRGNGPNEYNRVEDIFVEKNGIVGIKEPGVLKKYDLKKKFISKVKLLNNSPFVRKTGNSYVAYRLESGEAHSYIYLMNEDGEMVSQNLLIINKPAAMYFDCPNNLFNLGETVVFYDQIYDTVYHISSDEIISKYIFDFGNYKRGNSYWEKMPTHPLEKAKYMNVNKEKFMRLDRFYEGKNYLYFNTYPTNHFFFNKGNSKSVVASGIFNDIDGGIFKTPVAIFEDKMICVIESYELIEHMRSVRNRLSDQKFAKLQLNSKFKQLVTMTKSLDEMDNPILMVCEFKDF